MLGAYYYTIYLVVVTIMTLYQSNRYITTPYRLLDNRTRSRVLPSVLLMLTCAIVIGLRPDWVGFADSRNYIRIIEYYSGDRFVFNIDTDNILFDNLLYWVACNNWGWTIFFTIISFIYFGGIFVACKKMFPRDVLFAFLIYLAAFSTFSYATNGIKAGAAASLFLVAIAYRDKRWLSYLLMALSYGIHHSMQVLIVAYIIVSFIKNPKYYLWIWGFSFLMALFHISFFQHLFAGFTDDSGAAYLVFDSNSEALHLTGFRLDFIIYSAMPIILGYYLIFKRKLQSERFNFIYNLYVLTNSIWLLCMYANFTNRIAYLSWQLLPIVLIYPFFNEKLYPQQYKQANYIALAHLTFTLFMTFIYY